MVFQTAAQLIRSRGPDEVWRKNRIFRLSAHYLGRPRNIYPNAIRSVHRALVYATKARPLRRADRRDLWNARIEAGAREYNTSAPWHLTEGLDRAGVAVDRHCLADLAVWETRSFGALASIASLRLAADGIDSKHEDPVHDYVEWQLFSRKKLL